MHLFGKNLSSCPVAARGISAAVGLFLISSFSISTGCGAFGLTYSLTGLTVQPVANTTCIYPGATAQYRAYGTYTEGGHSTHIHEITDQVNWSVTFPTLASINTSGLLTAGTVAVGTSNVIASVQGELGILRATTNIAVSNSCSTTAVRGLSSLNIVPATATLLNAGDTEQPLALGVYPAGLRITDFTPRVRWQSSDTSVATVSANGIIRATGPGKAVVTARLSTAGGQVIAGSQTVVIPAAPQGQ